MKNRNINIQLSLGEHVALS